VTQIHRETLGHLFTHRSSPFSDKKGDHYSQAGTWSSYLRRAIIQMQNR
jgi:hypothetical protein